MIHLKGKKQKCTCILAIDPSNIETGWVVTKSDSFSLKKPEDFGKDDNTELIENTIPKLLESGRIDVVAIEMVESFGMAVGKSVFDTCVYIGRIVQLCEMMNVEWHFVTRKQEKLIICQSMRARDVNIRQALVDRYAPGERNYGKGTKKSPGFFYGFRADIWSAFAVAETFLQTSRLNPDSAAALVLK
jgi:hypothetical protein